MTRNLSKQLVIATTAFILAVTLVLGLVVHYKSSKKLGELGNRTSHQNALIVYHPDVFYNLDEQVCNAFAHGLLEYDW